LLFPRFYSFYGWIVFHYVCHIFFIQSSADEPFGCFHFLAIMNSAKMNMGVQMSLWHTDFIFFACIPILGVARLYGSSIFNFLRNLRTVIHNGCTNLHSYQPYTRVLFSLHPYQHLLSLGTLITAILARVWQYVITIFFSISLVISETECVCVYACVCTCWSFIYFLSKNTYLGLSPFLI
jgi:hypothetical protein